MHQKHISIKVIYPQLKTGSMSWNGCFDVLQRQRPTLQYKVVNWKVPNSSWVKVNIDGASKGNSGISSYRVYLRNELGNLIYVESGYIEIVNSIYVKATAILRVLQYCKVQGHEKVILEIDSLGLQKIILMEWKIPWEIVQIVEEIQCITETINIQVYHIFRETNTLVDYIANTAKSEGIQ